MICPLDWGIGHAARCIPIIRQLNLLGHEVILAASGGARALLESHFPELKMIDFPSVQVKYSRGKQLWLKLLLQLPKLIFSIYQDNRYLKRLVNTYQIDAVISDNRFGCWNKHLPSVYITHQVNLISPMPGQFLSSILAWLHHQVIKKYDACWIPDIDNPLSGGLAGRLSHPPPKHFNSRYIGLLSRFNKKTERTTVRPGEYILAILSGPEPQRSLLEEKILNELIDKPLIIIRGLPGTSAEPTPIPGISWYNHADDQLFEQLVVQASHIICRSGYSTIMDLVALGRTAHLIPTPGQSEQEYLAKYLSRQGLFSTQNQSERIVLSDFEPISNQNQALSTDSAQYVKVLEDWLQSLNE